MTDQQLSDELQQARLVFASAKAEQSLAHGARVITAAAAVMAREAWVEFINKADGVLDHADEATCRELAHASLALDELMDRGAALTKENKA